MSTYSDRFCDLCDAYADLERTGLWQEWPEDEDPCNAIVDELQDMFRALANGDTDLPPDEAEALAEQVGRSMW